MSKAAIVTGASSGIGLAISRVLCEKGYEVYGFGRDFAKEQTRELSLKNPMCIFEFPISTAKIIQRSHIVLFLYFHKLK